MARNYGLVGAYGAVAVAAFLTPLLAPATAPVVQNLGVAVGIISFALAVAQLKQPRSSIDALRAELVALCNADCNSALELTRSINHAGLDVPLTYAAGLRVVDRNDDRDPTQALIAHVAALRGRKVVLTGPPGSGKSVKLREIQQTVLASPEWHDVLPVYLRLADWDGITDSDAVTGWIVSSIRRQQPQMPSELLTVLLRSEKTLLLLDGFDEAATTGVVGRDWASGMVHLLNGLSYSTILTTRPIVYMSKVVERVSGDVAVLRLSDISVDQLAHQVLTSIPSTRQHIEEAIKCNRKGCLVKVLRRPLYLNAALNAEADSQLTATIASYRYSPNKAELRRDLEAALLSGHIERILSDSGGGGRTWSAEDSKGRARVAREAFHELAGYLKNYGGDSFGRDLISKKLLVPHYLWPMFGARICRSISVVITAILWLPVWILTLTLIRPRLPAPVFVAILALMTVGLVASIGLLLLPTPRRPVKIVISNVVTLDGLRAVGSKRLAVGLVVMALAASGSTVPAYRSAVWSLFAAGFFVAFAVGLATAVRPDVDLLVAGASGVLVGAAVGRASLYLFAGNSTLVAFDCGAGSGALALMVGASLGAVAWRRKQQPNMAYRGLMTTEPYARLVADWKTGCALGVLAAVLTLFATWGGGLFRSVPLPLAFCFALAAGLCAGPGLVAVSSRLYASMLIAGRGRVPIRLHRFLFWGHRVGLLRRGLGGYEFSHERVENYFRR